MRLVMLVIAWLINALVVHGMVARTAIAQQATSSSRASIPLARNTVYFEAGGNARTWSLNYDRLLTDRIAFRLGASASSKVTSWDVGATRRLLVPIMLSYLPGTGSNRLELGIGPRFELDQGSRGTADRAPHEFTATIGYRYQPVSGRLLFRVGFTPIFARTTFMPWGGMSLGYGF